MCCLLRHRKRHHLRLPPRKTDSLLAQLRAGLFAFGGHEKARWTGLVFDCVRLLLIEQLAQHSRVLALRDGVENFSAEQNAHHAMS